MVPRMICNLGSGGIQLPDLFAGHQIPLVLFPPFIFETADEKGCAEAELFQERCNVFILTDHSIIEWKDNCSHNNIFPVSDFGLRRLSGNPGTRQSCGNFRLMLI